MIDKIGDKSYDVDELIEKHCTDVPSSQIIMKEKEKIKPDIDFAIPSDAFWKTHDNGSHYQDYKSGLLSGTFNKRLPSLKGLIDTLMEPMKSISRSAYATDDTNADDLNDYFTMINNAFTLLLNKLDSEMDETIDGELVTAHLHGVINSFITTNIERD